MAHADGTLAKPFHAGQMAAAVQGLLGPGRMIAASDRPEQRLAELLGADAAAAMLARFFGGLEAAIGQVEAGDDARAIGHKIGGLAGMIGYTVLSDAWLTLEEHGAAGWPTIRALSREAIARHDKSSPSPEESHGA